MIDLSQADSLCEPNAKIIVSRDKRQQREHRAYNIDRDSVRHYQIDGGVITDLTQTKCDFMLLNDTKSNAYLIELKGTDLHHAIEQLNNSRRLLDSVLRTYTNVYYRIVYRSNTHALRGTEFAYFRRAVGGKVLAKTDLISEDI